MRIAEKPGLFLVLLTGSFLLLILGLVLVSFLAPMLSLFAISLAVIFLILGLGIAGLIGTLLLSRPLPLLRRPMQWAVQLLYPIALTLGKLTGIEKDKVRGSFIELHNKLARMRHVQVSPEQILILLPHCLQWAQCKIKITTEVSNCRRCGKCKIGELLDLQDKYGFHMAVATGGTLARKIIKDTGPKVVIGVACERDLTSGIQDVQEIHVLGVTNERPFGPCFNTSLDVTKIEEAVRSVVI